MVIIFLLGVFALLIDHYILARFSLNSQIELHNAVDLAVYQRCSVECYATTPITL